MMLFQKRPNIKDDEPCVLFCSIDNAERFMRLEPNVGDCIVTSPIFSDDIVAVTTKQEFLDWLYGNEEEQE